MADLKITVDVVSLVDAKKKLEAFQSQMGKTNSVLGLTRALSSVERNIADLIKAKDKNQLSDRAFQKGLLEQRKALEAMGMSSYMAKKRVEELANALKNDQAMRRAAQAAEELARAQQQAAERTRQLRMQFQQGYAASEAYRRQAIDLQEALRQGIINTEQYRQALSRLRAEQRAADAAAQGLARGINTTGVITQQAGYQIGDFLVQVQSGTNAFVAFGQQATQIAGTLTLLGGKWIAIGSALGIAIPLFTAVAAGIMRTRKEAEQVGTDLVSAFGSFEGAVNDVASAQERYNQAVVLMGDIQSETTKSVLNSLQQELSARQALLRVQRAELELKRESLQSEIASRQEVIQQAALPAMRQGDMFPGSFVDPSAAARREDILKIVEANRQLFLQQAKSNAELNLTDALLQQIDDNLAAVIDGYVKSAEANGETNKALAKQNSFISTQVADLENQTRLMETILSFGEDSAEVEAERARQAKEAFLLEVMRNGIYGEQLTNLMALYDEHARINEILAKPVQGPNLPTSTTTTTRTGGGAAPGIGGFAQSLLTEMEQIELYRENALEQLENFNSLELELLGGHAEAKLRIEEEYQSRLNQLRQEQFRGVVDSQKAAQGAFLDLLGTLGQKSQSAAKLLIAINTGLSIAQAIQNTAVAATRALAELGPVAGAAAAGKIKAFGAAQVALIAANGALRIGSVGAGSGGGGGSIGSVGPIASSSAPSPQRIVIEGIDRDSLISGEQLSRLFDRLYEENSERGIVFSVAR